MANFDLRSNVEAAKEIGFLTMFSANLRLMLVPILGALLGDEVVAHIIAVKIENLSATLDILFEVAGHRPADPLAQAIMAEKPTILAAIALRNRLAHCLYVSDDRTGESQIYDGLITDRRGKPKITKLDAKEIRGKCDGLDKAVARIMVAGGTRIKHPYDGHVVLPS